MGLSPVSGALLDPFSGSKQDVVSPFAGYQEQEEAEFCVGLLSGSYSSYYRDVC